MDIIKKIFKELNSKSIKYSIDKMPIGRLQKFKISRGVNELGYIQPAPYPKNLIKKISLKIDKGNVNSLAKILKNLNFTFFPYKGLNFFLFDKTHGLLEIEADANIKAKKIPRKNFICFVGAEGSGKTTTLSAVYTALENFPVKIKIMNFSSFRESKIWRIYDLTKKIFIIIFNKNKLILSDRYIYLTFSKNKIFKKILKFLTPEPDIVFIMKCDYKILKKRRGTICSNRENVERMYSLFREAKNKIEIDTSKNNADNLTFIVNKILKLYEKPIRKFI